MECEGGIKFDYPSNSSDTYQVSSLTSTLHPSTNSSSSDTWHCLSIVKASGGHRVICTLLSDDNAPSLQFDEVFGSVTAVTGLPYFIVEDELLSEAYLYFTDNTTQILPSLSSDPASPERVLGYLPVTNNKLASFDSQNDLFYEIIVTDGLITFAFHNATDYFEGYRVRASGMYPLAEDNVLVAMVFQKLIIDGAGFDLYVSVANLKLGSEYGVIDENVMRVPHVTSYVNLTFTAVHIFSDLNSLVM